MNNKNILFYSLTLLITLGLNGCDEERVPTVLNTLNGLSYKTCTSSVEITYLFSSYSTGTITRQGFSDATCTTTQPVAPSVVSFSYVVGDPLTASDGLSATELNILNSGVITYTIMRLSSGSTGTGYLNFGAANRSSSGRDGFTEENRHDGLDLNINYALQP